MADSFPMPEPDRDGELVWSPAGGNQEDSVGGNSHLYSYRYRDHEGRWRSESFLVDIGLLHRSAFYGDEQERIDTPDHTALMPRTESAGGLMRAPVDQPVIGAILITHGHSDHIAGLAAHMQAGGMTPPIYASRYTANIIRSHLAANGIDKDRWPDINEVKPGDRIRLSERITVDVAGATHSIPQALSFLVETPTVRHFHSGDIKVDDGSIVAGGTDLGRLREWGRRGIDSALMDATGAPKEGWAKREQQVRDEAFAQVAAHPGKRVTYGVLGSYVEQLAGLAEVAARTDRALLYAGRSVETHMAALKMSGIDLPAIIQKRTGKPLRIMEIGSDEARKLKPSQALQVVSGVDAAENAPLTKAALGQLPGWQPSGDDVVIWPEGFRTAQPRQTEAVERAFRQRRVELIRGQKRSHFGEGHGRSEDLRAVLKQLKPRVVIPTHGVVSMQQALGRIAEELGSSVRYAVNGDIMRLARDGVQNIGRRAARWLPTNKTSYPDQPRFSAEPPGFAPGAGPEATASRPHL